MESYTNGLVIGKFMPPHKGHELLIDFASRNCNMLTVIISGKDDDFIPLDDRYTFLKNMFRHVNIIKLIDDVPNPTYDSNGTAIDEWFWDLWMTKFRDALEDSGINHIDKVFSSDLYGEKLANKFDAVWIPVDPNREIFQTSGTMIRTSFKFGFEFLIQEAKEEYRQTFVISGPESVGKSTMTKQLAEYFGSKWIPEYGRTVSEARKNNLTMNDFKTILDGHSTLRNMLKSQSNFALFEDTDAFTTYLFSKIYLDESLRYEDIQYACSSHYRRTHTHILLAPTVPWVNDGERILPEDDKRWEFFNDMKNILDVEGIKHVVIDAQDFKTRFEMAVKEVENRLTWDHILQE